MGKLFLPRSLLLTRPGRPVEAVGSSSEFVLTSAPGHLPGRLGWWLPLPSDSCPLTPALRPAHSVLVVGDSGSFPALPPSPLLRLSPRHCSLVFCFFFKFIYI